MIHSSWDINCNRQIFFVILGHFLPFYPTNSPKNENIKKMKKVPGDIIILHKCTKNHNYMLYCCWDMARGCNCHFSFGQFFPIYPHNSPKNEHFKKNEKKPRDIIILENCTKNYDYRPYCSWDMMHDGCNCCFSFWAIFCPFTSLTAQKMKISKKWKKFLEISSLYMCVPKIMIRWCTVPEIWCVMNEWTDGRTDGKSEI